MIKLFTNRKALLLLLILASFLSYAQNPAHFYIGENELDNLDIYSILETNDEHIYLATNDGVYRYQYGHFKKNYNQDGVGSQSLFGLVENDKGEVFCHNLSGEIFTIKDQHLVKYLSLPQKLVGNRIRMLMDKDNQLIFFSSKSCFRISNENTYKILYSQFNGDLEFKEISQLPDKRILISYGHMGMYLEIKEDSLIHHSFKNADKNSDNYEFNSYFLLKDVLIKTDRGNFKPINKAKQLNNGNFYKNQFHTVNENEVWGLKTNNGIGVFSLNDDGDITHNATYFDQHLISSFFKSKSGAIYLATFGQGVIVIPNYNTMVFEANAVQGKIRDFAVSDDNEVFYSEMDRGIMLYKNDSVQLIQEESNSFFHAVYWRAFANFNIEAKHPELFYNVQSEKATDNFPTTNDVVTIDSTLHLLGTSKGLKLIGNLAKFPQIKWFKDKAEEVFYTNKKLNTRIRALAYHLEKETLYMLILNSVVALEKNGMLDTLMYNGKPIYSNDIACYQGKLYTTSEEGEILIFKDGIYSDQINLSKGDASDLVRQILIKNDTLYALGNDLIYYLNVNDKVVHTAGIEMGITETVNKLDISKNKLWLLLKHSKFISVRLEDLKTSEQLNVYLDSITIENHKVNHTAQGEFGYQQNNLTAYVDFRSLRFADKAKIGYRLVGYNDEWKYLEKRNEQIAYAHLPPGSYTLEIFSKLGNIQSETLQYSFTIQTPFWMQWWFYLLLLFIITLLVWLLFRWRIKRIRRKQRELYEKQELRANFVEAELKALRSQMNPHFIFNSLHAIQALILKLETDKAYDYVVLFSKLVRNTLSHSENEFIPIKSEIDFIDVYLQLETLRFGDDFYYEISYSGTDDILVPSLLIQPFIENALLHGLQHKTDAKKLKISFDLNEHLVCTITDNGIGRTAAQKINERQGRKHTSFALEAIKRRLQAFQHEFGKAIDYTITDVVIDGEVAGTQVSLVMPYRNHFI